MTGCPNGCARPYVADIAFVGRSMDQYLVLVGGQSNGTRLNTAYKDLVHRQDLVREVTALFDHFAHERIDGETFGDFSLRIGVDSLRARADLYLAQHNGTNQNQVTSATNGAATDHTMGESTHAGHTVTA
jgi:sulfite reductase beta subunit-like hemoprotein